MTFADFEARSQNSGGAERANYGLFLQDLCDLIGVPRPDPMTDNPAHDAYVLERPVERLVMATIPNVLRVALIFTNAVALSSKPNREPNCRTATAPISRKPLTARSWVCHPKNGAKVTPCAERPGGSR